VPRGRGRRTASGCSRSQSLSHLAEHVTASLERKSGFRRRLATEQDASLGIPVGNEGCLELGSYGVLLACIIVLIIVSYVWGQRQTQNRDVLVKLDEKSVKKRSGRKRIGRK